MPNPNLATQSRNPIQSSNLSAIAPTTLIEEYQQHQQLAFVLAQRSLAISIAETGFLSPSTCSTRAFSPPSWSHSLHPNAACTSASANGLPYGNTWAPHSHTISLPPITMSSSDRYQAKRRNLCPRFKLHIRSLQTNVCSILIRTYAFSRAP